MYHYFFSVSPPHSACIRYKLSSLSPTHLASVHKGTILHRKCILHTKANVLLQTRIVLMLVFKQIVVDIIEGRIFWI